MLKIWYKLPFFGRGDLFCLVTPLILQILVVRSICFVVYMVFDSVYPKGLKMAHSLNLPYSCI